MSDYHILEQARDKKTISVVFHVAVPAGGTNEANIPWGDAIVLHLGGAAAITSVLPDVTGTQEETDMKTGAIIEIRGEVRFSGVNMTNSERRVEIEAAYINAAAAEIIEKQEDLAFIGFNADVT